MASTSENRKNSASTLLQNLQFPKLDLLFDKYLNHIFYISLFLLFLFGILLFDTRISTGGDDSDYLMQAVEFSRGESFPSFHGIFYVLLFGWLIKLVGFNLVFFKSLSLLFLLGHHVFLFLSFRRRVSPLLLGAVLIISSVSSGIIYYGSQTYTEAFYMFLQSLMIYLLLTDFKDEGKGFMLKKYWKIYLATGAVLFMMAATRNVGYAALGAVLVYFLLERKYLQSLGVFLGYLAFLIPFSLYKKVVWGVQGSDLSAQMQILLQKDPYNASLGHENFSGMMERFFENTGYYLSTVFLQESGLQNSGNQRSYYLISFIVILLLIVGLVYTWGKNRSVYRLVFLYTGMALLITLFSLNPMWRQSRLLIIYMPLLILLLFYTLAETANRLNMGFVRFLLVGLLAVIFLGNFSRTLRKASEMSEIRGQMREGNTFSGYTPDFGNFLAMSEWAAANTRKDVSIASRKASMSFIYGDGRSFHAIYKLPYKNTGKVLSQIHGDTSVFFVNALKLQDREGKHPAMVSSLKGYVKAIIYFDDDIYAMFQPGTDSMHADSLIRAAGIDSMRHSAGRFTEIAGRSKGPGTLIPDDLLDHLYRNNVHYLIKASLRVNPNEKTDDVINTIERYMAAINGKYPEVFALVHQIGNDDEEPACLYKIDYEYCKKRGWAPGQ